MTFKVVKIVDEYLIVVDYGLKHDAQEGDILEVIMVGEEVIDPDTFESLGTLDAIKGRVRVKNAYERMSLCISDEKIVIPNPNVASFSSTLTALSKTFNSTEVKALRVNAEQITGGYDEEAISLISIGDQVKVRKAEEYDPDE